MSSVRGPRDMLVAKKKKETVILNRKSATYVFAATKTDVQKEKV